MPTCSMGSIASMRGNTWEHAPPERGPASQARRGPSTRDPSWGSLGTEEVPHTLVDLNERCKEHRLWVTGECAAAMAHILRGLAGGWTWTHDRHVAHLHRRRGKPRRHRGAKNSGWCQ